MSYQHILVAIDLSENSQLLVDKTIALAKPLQADVSFIHIDVNNANIYTGLIDISKAYNENHTLNEYQKGLQSLVEYSNYPIRHTLVGSGDLGHELCENIAKFNVDLVVCGHHQDFWSKLLSSARQLINCSPVDLLVIPIHD